MAARKLAESADVPVADLIHDRSPALPVSATVGDMRAWFAESSHRRLAVIADDGRYAGSLTPEDVRASVADDVPAAQVARSGPTVAPDAPASVGYERATASDARRVAVVDAAGQLVGVLAVTEDLTGFCGTG